MTNIDKLKAFWNLNTDQPSHNYVLTGLLPGILYLAWGLVAGCRSRQVRNLAHPTIDPTVDRYIALIRRLHVALSQAGCWKKMLTS